MNTNRNSSNNNTTSSSSTTTTTTTSSTRSSSTSISTEPGVYTNPLGIPYPELAKGGILLTPQQQDELAELYEDVIGTPMNTPVMALIRQCAKEGMTYEVIREAVMVTGLAPNPTGFYLRAVLRRWCMDAIKTQDDLRADRSERRRELKSRRRW